MDNPFPTPRAVDYWRGRARTETSPARRTVCEAVAAHLALVRTLVELLGMMESDAMEAKLVEGGLTPAVAARFEVWWTGTSYDVRRRDTNRASYVDPKDVQMPGLDADDPRHLAHAVEVALRHWPGLDDA